MEYIKRLNDYLNPNNDPYITTAMWNKEIIPNVTKVNYYNRFMVVFDYDEDKDSHKCFSYSSPKLNDSNNDLTFYVLPTRTKIMLNSPIDIPTKYIIKADFDKMLRVEMNSQIKRNLWFNKENLELVRLHKDEIYYQYQCIKYNSDVKGKFDSFSIQKAHSKMIDENAVEKFCKKEVQSLNNESQNNKMVKEQDFDPNR